MEEKLTEFYPLEFLEDKNGAKQNWEAIAQIPFIDETKLIEE